MTTATRSNRSIKISAANNLVGLDSTLQKKLEDNYQITTIQDLALLDKQGIDTILGTNASTFFVRKKLSMVINFLRREGQFCSTTTMSDVVALKSNPRIIGQAAFKFLLLFDATDQEEKEQDEELFNVFKNSFVDGKAYKVITQSLVSDKGNTVDLSGKRVWKHFLQWCNSGGRKNTLIKNAKDKIRSLKLNREDADGFDYVNMHILVYRKLRHMVGKFTETERMATF
eukprot:10917349-Ditylum_brightwellii.AAC.1